MSSLEQCRQTCEEFIRYALPSVAQTMSILPFLPAFTPEPSHRKERFRFVESKAPNWWQLPNDLSNSLMNSKNGRAFALLVETTSPFREIIGKTFYFQELGRAYRYTASNDIAIEFLKSYLFAAGPERWKASKFNMIWLDLINYFDPANTTIGYHLYAPIAFMSGVKQSLILNEGLEIKRISVHEVARLATINSRLAGVTLHHRFMIWPVHFFVKRLTLSKSISDKEHLYWSNPPFVAQLNEEVAILRALLNENLAVPHYALIRDKYPFDPGGGTLNELPWRVRYPNWLDAPKSKHIKRYSVLRGKYLELRGERGWETLAASMRRFAVAWENPFRSDILADIVAALENLIAHSNTEVSYRLRVRVAHFLAKSASGRQEIVKNLTDAYAYRSRTFHGGFVFDNIADLDTAIYLKGAKGKHGNPFHDVNEVHRLIYQITIYYRELIMNMIDRGQLEIDWNALGL